MKIQRLPILMAGALATILASACSSGGGSGSGTASQQVGVRDEYEAQGDLPAEGGITEITFYDDKVYSLKQTIGCATGEALCHEYGTYVLDTGSKSLTLTTSAGVSRTLPFTAGKVSDATAMAPSSANLDVLGGVLGASEGGTSLGGGGSLGSREGGVALGSGSGTALTSDASTVLICIQITLLASFTIGGQTFTADLSVTIKSSSGGDGGASGCSGSSSGSGSGSGGTASDSSVPLTSDSGGILNGSGSGSGTSLTGDSGSPFGSGSGSGSSSGSGSGSSGGGGPGSGSGSSGASSGSGSGSGSPAGSGSGSGASSGSGSGSSSSGGSSGSGSGSSSGSGSGSSGADAGASTATALGVDVSHYQGSSINWSTVLTGNGFAYAKATEGTSYVDSAFGTNWQALKTAGLTRGAYHFFRASLDPVAQADFFVQTLANKGGFNAGSDLAPMVDVEVLDGVSASTLFSNLQKFVTEAQTKLGGGVKLVVYTGPSFWTNTLGNPDLSSNPLWIAHYTSAAQPVVPSHWSNYTIWQYSDVRVVPGIGAAGVDADRFHGSQAAVSAFVTSDP